VPALREVQERFYDAVLLEEGAALHGIVREPATPSVHRIDVCRNNAREAFRKTLAADYPVVERLVGTECFRWLARSYARQRPSRSGDLQDFGRGLARFLDERYGGGEFAYLADVARLEWACQGSLLALDAHPIGVECLEEHRVEDVDALRLRLHPAARFVRSPYPIFRIWQLNQPGADEDATVDLASGGDAVLVFRRAGRIELRRLDVGEWTFLAALRAGETLGAALDAAFAEDPGFDLAPALSRAFARELVVDCTRPGIKPGLPSTAQSR